MKMPLYLTGCLALLLLCANARSETFYRWVDADGSVRVTSDQPKLGVPYKSFEVPDAKPWLNAPEIPPALDAGGAQSPQGLFKAASASVYGLMSQQPAGGAHPGATLYGSAVAVTDKLAITNCHIIEDAGEEIYLGDGNGSDVERATLVAANYVADRCVVSVSRMQLRPVPGVRRFEQIEVGETVFAIGNPLQLERTLSNGLLSAKRVKGDRRYLQTSAAISPGSSGGGLFDAQGNLLGITSFTLKGSQNINFAIPAEDFWN